MKYNDLIYEKATGKFYVYICYRPDLNVHVLCQNNKIRNINLNKYIEIDKDKFYIDYCFSYETTKIFLKDELNEKIKNISIKIPEKILRKKKILEKQLACMKKMNADIEHIKSWERAIRRENKKIEKNKQRKESYKEELEKEFQEKLNALETKRKENLLNTFFR